MMVHLTKENAKNKLQTTPKSKKHERLKQKRRFGCGKKTGRLKPPTPMKLSAIFQRWDVQNQLINPTTMYLQSKRPQRRPEATLRRFRNIFI